PPRGLRRVRMLPRMLRPLCVIASLAIAFAYGSIATPGEQAQSRTITGGTENGEWPSYHGDLRNFHYSPLSQIDASNFNRLEVAWRFKTDSLGPRPEFKLEGTP